MTRRGVTRSALSDLVEWAETVKFDAWGKRSIVNSNYAANRRQRMDVRWPRMVVRHHERRMLRAGLRRRAGAQPRGSADRDGAVIVAVVAVGVMNVPRDEIVGVIAACPPLMAHVDR
jgi:hypothetical protein